MRNTLKFLAVAAMAIVLSVPSQAQNPAVFSGTANAWAFAYGVNPIPPALQIDSPTATTGAGVATFSVAFGTVALGDGTIIAPLAINAPVTVGTASNFEIVTPTAVSCGTPNVYQSCTFTATFTHPHGTGDRIGSASNGLQEAANYLVGKHGATGSGLVELDPSWFARYASHAAGITALTGYTSPAITLTVLDYSGISGSVSYTAAVGVVYAATAHVLY